MLRIGMRQAEAIFGIARAPRCRTITREALQASNSPKLKAFIEAGVPVTLFLESGFSLNELVDLGLSGACYENCVGPARFAGLEGKWGELLRWNIYDLIAANATMADLRLLGVTLPGVMGRPLFGHGFPLLHTVSMREWRDFGITKEVLMGLRSTESTYKKLGWAYGDMVACWGFTPADMQHIGYRISLGSVRK